MRLLGAHRKTRKGQLGSGFLAHPISTREEQSVTVQCLTLSHMLMSPENNQDWLEARWLYLIWDGLMSWLCLMFTWNPLSPPQLKVFVCGCVCPMASCFQKAQFNIEKKLLCQTLPPMKWLTKPHSTQVTTMTFSKCGGLQSCVQSVEWKNVPLCTSCLRKSSGGDKRQGSLPVVSFAPMCSFAATKPGRL